MAETPMWRRYLRFLGSDPAADANDEVQFHLAERVADLTRRGLSDEEAREQAHREFGDPDRVRRELEEIGRERRRRRDRARIWESVGQDVRLAARGLRRSPGFAAVAVLTLAIGIGAGTAMFSVLNAVLLRDLPVRDPGELVVLWTEAPEGAVDHLPVSQGELTAYRTANRAFRSVAGVAYHGATEQALRDGDQSLTVPGTWVTGDLFPVLGVAPVVGRTLLPEDDVVGAAPVMVIGEGLWQRHFGGDPAAVGRVLEWNGTRYTVVGVLPAGLEIPRGAEFWVPVSAALPEEVQKPISGYVLYDVVGRLRPGVGMDQARDDYEAFLRATDAERPTMMRGATPVLVPLMENVTGDARSTLWAAAAAVGLLLLIACVNVANLLLIRGSERTQELAVRTAIGAGRGRLVRQLLTESGLLAVLGGALGIALAFAAVRVLVALAPPELPRRETIAVDGAVLAFALAVTAAAALLAGLLPALVSAAGDLGVWLRGGARSVAGSRSGQALRHGLVVGQVSLAILVVVAAGLLVRSLLTLQGVDMGFNDERLLVFQTSLAPGLVTERPRQLAMREQMLERVRAIPGVSAAATLSASPFSGEAGWTAMYTGDGQTPEQQGTNPLINMESVGPEYFGTLEVPIRRGRAFTEQDRDGMPPVAIVSEAVAQHTWPGQDPIGKRVKLGPATSPAPWHEVVGVVGETRYRELANPQPSLYLATLQFGGPVPMTLGVRSRAEAEAVIPQVRAALREVHPEWILVGGGSMRQLLAAPLARPRFSTLLLGTFAALTLLLAAVGIYGVMAATVRQRTREIGIRLALGAGMEQVRGLVLRQGMRLAALGCAVGIAAAVLGTRTLRGMLFGISPTDPLTFVAVAGLILGTAALACYVPARRASRVDPVHALRAE